MRLRLKIDTLDHRWHDRDNVMLHAAFQTLVDFIEKEKPEEMVDHEGSGPETHWSWTELNLLYIWWVNREHLICESEEDQTMLHRLVDVREYMWS